MFKVIAIKYRWNFKAIYSSSRKQMTTSKSDELSWRQSWRGRLRHGWNFRLIKCTPICSHFSSVNRYITLQQYKQNLLEKHGKQTATVWILRQFLKLYLLGYLKFKFAYGINFRMPAPITLFTAKLLTASYMATWHVKPRYTIRYMSDGQTIQQEPTSTTILGHTHVA